MAILAASAVAYLTKFVGYLLPRRMLESERFRTVTSAVTIGLLAALVASNTFASGQQLAIDSRLLALAAAIIALLARAPFLLVVVLGAAAAAAGRLLGLP